MVLWRPTVLSDPGVVSSWRFLPENDRVLPRSEDPALCAPGMTLDGWPHSATPTTAHIEDLFSRAQQLLESNETAVPQRKPSSTSSISVPRRDRNGSTQQVLQRVDASQNQRARDPKNLGLHVDFDSYIYGKSSTNAPAQCKAIDKSLPGEQDRINNRTDDTERSASDRAHAGIESNVVDSVQYREPTVLSVKRHNRAKQRGRAVELPPVVDSSFNFSPRARARPPRYGAWYLPAASWQVGGTRPPPQRLTEEERQHIAERQQERQKLEGLWNRPQGKYFRSRYKEFLEGKNAHIPPFIE